MNVINGGAHANNSLRIQEFMIRPETQKHFLNAVQYMCFLVIQNLKNAYKSKKIFQLQLGDEGGFAPSLKRNEDAIRIYSRIY